MAGIFQNSWRGAAAEADAIGEQQLCTESEATCLLETECYSIDVDHSLESGGGVYRRATEGSRRSLTFMLHTAFLSLSSGSLVCELCRHYYFLNSDTSIQNYAFHKAFLAESADLCSTDRQTQTNHSTPCCACVHGVTCTHGKMTVPLHV